MSRFTKTLIIAAMAGPALFGATPAAARRDSPDVELQKLLAGREAGRPVDCIQLSSVTSSTIIDGQAIVYRIGGTLYINTPRSGASSLDDDDILVTRSFGSQLCSRDTVNLVSRAGRIPHGFVLLGDFVPYRRVKQGR